MAKMSQENKKTEAQPPKTEPKMIFTISSSPHLSQSATSRRVMCEVSLAMIPAMAAAIYLFGPVAAIILAVCVVAALATEWAFNAVRKKTQTIGDFSVVVTALILGLSLPPTIPAWAAAMGTIVAVAVAKMLFGGLGSNIFNPAMVGRAFLMACFGMMMTTWTAPIDRQADGQVAAVTQPTPLAVAKQAIKDAHNPDKAAPDKQTAGAANRLIESMFMGNISGSVGETSAICWLIGGLFLLLRRTITIHIPLAVLGSATAIAAIAWLVDPEIYANPLVHLCGGGLMMCAFFIATDPVTCPLTKLGRIIFGVGVGGLIMLIRLKGGYPEGVMYAILLMNAMTPLIDRWTRPVPMGGHVRVG